MEMFSTKKVKQKPVSAAERVKRYRARMSELEKQQMRDRNKRHQQKSRSKWDEQKRRTQSLKNTQRKKERRVKQGEKKNETLWQSERRMQMPFDSCCGTEGVISVKTEEEDSGQESAHRVQDVMEMPSAKRMKWKPASAAERTRQYRARMSELKKQQVRDRNKQQQQKCRLKWDEQRRKSESLRSTLRKMDYRMRQREKKIESLHKSKASMQMTSDYCGEAQGVSHIKTEEEIDCPEFGILA